MPRFFFEVENDHTLYEDPHGELYPNTEAALRGTQRLADEPAEQADVFAGSTLLVLDEAGAKVGRFFIRPPQRATAMTDDAARDELEERIRDRAYRIWLDEGQPDGKYLDHWLRAKREVEEEDAIIKGTEKLKQD